MINPPKYFNIKNAKKIDIKSIESSKENLIENIKNIFTIKFLGKSFYRMTRKCDLDKVDNIYYYCNNHRTAKNSEEITEKGNPKRVSICNARIIYNKTCMEFYTDWEHSSLCKYEKIEKYQNVGEINEEIENYKHMEETLLNYLNSNTMITCSDFIKIAFKLYNKNNCQYKVENYTFKNFYYGEKIQ